MYAALWTRETLKYKIPKEVLENNKSNIINLINNFKLQNPNINDNFYVLGTSSLILQDYLAKDLVRDIDVYCDYSIKDKPDEIDIVKNDIMPIGWKDRVVNINGINCISVFDIVCTLAFSYTKKPLREILMLWLLRDFDLEEVKAAMKQKLDSGIGVTESDFKHYDKFCKEITQRLIDLNRHPQKRLIEKLIKYEQDYVGNEI